MSRVRRAALLCLLGLALVAALCSMASAETWPSMANYSISLSSAPEAHVQINGGLWGPIGGNFGAKISAWWVTGGTDHRLFLADTYVDYTRKPLYVAVGRKYVPFGPAGLLVSPGIGGAEAKYQANRVSLQAIAGTLQFTPVVGTDRLTYAGTKIPSDESIAAARVAVDVVPATNPHPTTLGLNLLKLDGDSGDSLDLSLQTMDWMTLFGEVADFDGVHAHAYGVRLSNQKHVKNPSRHSLLTIYNRRVPVGFRPADLGATGYFQGMDGWAMGYSQQLDDFHGVGVFADRHDAIFTYFQTIPLH